MYPPGTPPLPSFDDASAHHVTIPKDAPRLVLRRLDQGPPPIGACVHGYVACAHCRAMLYIGHHDDKLLRAGKALPVCAHCVPPFAVNLGTPN